MAIIKFKYDKNDIDNIKKSKSSEVPTTEKRQLEYCISNNKGTNEKSSPILEKWELLQKKTKSSSKNKMMQEFASIRRNDNLAITGSSVKVNLTRK